MVTPVFSTDDIHTNYLKWMNEQEGGSYRKDRFLQMLESIPADKQYEIEKWIVASFAKGLEIGYSKSNDRFNKT